MYPRLLQPPIEKSFFLFGPRGTGKSTWIRQVLPKAILVDLLRAKTYERLLAAPHRLEELIPPEYKGWVVLDEIQRVPELLNEVHRLIEERHIHFAMTGSSARKLRRKGVNLLAGRAVPLSMHPLTALELGHDFDLRRSLQYGQMPSAYVESSPQDYLDGYVSTYLREEIQQEGLTRNLGAFSRFLEAASFSQGAVLNISTVARDCSVERKVVEEYFQILDDLLLACRLPVFTKKAKRRMIAHPKFYFFDVGIFRTIRPMGPLDLPEEAEGPAFETLILQELRAINTYLRLGYDIFYWRTAKGHEVDFVLYGKRGIHAFEIKRGGRLRDEDFRGLEAFLEDYPMAKARLIYGGNNRESRGPIEVIPITECLRTWKDLLR